MTSMTMMAMAMSPKMMAPMTNLTMIIQAL
jgi:hypothetical protein